MTFARYIALALLIAFVLILLLGSRDAPPPNTSDLEPVYSEVDDEKNAFTYFNAMTNVFFYPYTNQGWIADALYTTNFQKDTRVVELIERNAEAVSMINQGLQFDICQIPEIRDINAGLPFLCDWLKMSKVLALKARYECFMNEPEKAVSSCILLLRFGDKLQGNANSIMVYLTGSSVLPLGLNQVRQLVYSGSLSKQQLSSLAAALTAITPLDAGIRNALKGECCFIIQLMDDLVSGKYINEDSPISALSPVLRKKVLSGYLFHPNQTKTLIADAYRVWIDDSCKFYAEQSVPEPEKESMSSGLGAWRLIKPNVVGQIFYPMFLIGPKECLQKKCEMEADVKATQIIVATARYKKEHGAAPDSLALYIPDYLNEVPLDPFDGQAFHYIPEEGIIYSVGENCIDDNGSTNKTAGKSDHDGFSNRTYVEDIVYRLH